MVVRREKFLFLVVLCAQKSKVAHQPQHVVT